MAPPHTKTARPSVRRRTAILMLALAGRLVLAGGVPSCERAGEPRPPDPRSAPSESSAAGTVRAKATLSPDSAETPWKWQERCGACHPATVRSFARHGMARSLGPMDPSRTPPMPDGTWIENPRAGAAYRVEAREGGLAIVERGRRIGGIDLGGRSRPLVRAIGAGLMDQSFVAREGGRHVFAPLEFFTADGWQLAPAERQGRPLRLANEITRECYGCHTTEPVPDPYPPGLFEDYRPSPIGCDACHTDAEAHRRLAGGGVEGADGWEAVGDPRPLAAIDLAALPRERRMDLCARCHAQGDARIEIPPSPEPPFQAGEALFSRRIVFVAARPSDDFGFANQTERLVHSACFAAADSPSGRGLDCLTCHDPHVSTRETSPGAYEEACLRCHDAGGCTRPAALRVEDVTDETRLSGRHGCVSCHMRRSASFDLTGVRVTDHWIRRTIPLPRDNDSPRSKESPEGDWAVLHYGTAQERGDAAARGKGGTGGEARRAMQEAGARAMAWVHRGKMEEAAELFERFPPPGSPEATSGAVEAGARFALSRNPSFHLARGLALEALGRGKQAEAAFRDALRLRPDHAHASIHLARIRLGVGDAEGALEILGRVLEAHPSADHGWDVLARVAERRRDAPLLLTALSRQISSWPHDPAPARELGSRTLSSPDPSLAFEAFRLAAQLDPDAPGVWRGLGLSAARVGESSLARAALEEELRRDPSDRAARQAMERLSSRPR